MADEAPRALVRVYVPTYRRATLLGRALDSLRAQTFPDWVCEVHNDDPDDPAPSRLVRQLGDPRILLIQHQTNLGARATFNLFYRPTRERYASLLEDDNWWEPEFLEIMYREMERHPAVVLGWCNQQIWEELADGSWKNTRTFVSSWKGEESRLVTFGEVRQITGAVHSHGSMLLRSRHDASYETPLDWPLAAIEQFRERMMPHPLLYVPRPLGVFSRTLQTARNESHAEWMMAQTILAATFFKHYRGGEAGCRELITDAREVWSLSMIPLFMAAFLQRECRSLLRYMRPVDWYRLLRAMARRPAAFRRVFRCRQDHPDWWRALDRHTAARFAERPA